MSRELFQKPLGWLQRFYYNVERGEVPFPQPVTVINHDWPLEYRSIVENSATVVGTQGVQPYIPGVDKHGLVVAFSTSAVGAGFPATDAIFVRLLDPALNPVVLALVTGLASSSFPLIGGGPLFSNTAVYQSIPPVYVPPGWQLDYQHGSVAGGVTIRLNLAVIERQKSYPLRLP